VIISYSLKSYEILEEVLPSPVTVMQCDHTKFDRRT